LNEEQITHFSVVRVALSTSYDNPGEGNRRASRNSQVTSSPPIPNITIRNFSSLYGYTASASLAAAMPSCTSSTSPSAAMRFSSTSAWLRKVGPRGRNEKQRAVVLETSAAHVSQHRRHPVALPTAVKCVAQHAVARLVQPRPRPPHLRVHFYNRSPLLRLHRL
jgi:hypothetical protein